MGNKVVRIILWVLTGAYALLGASEIVQVVRGQGEGGHFTLIWGTQLLIIAAVAATAILLARKRNGWVVLASVVLLVGLPVSFFVSFLASMINSESRQREERREFASGQYAFGGQPALYAIAQAIVANDQNAIRTAAKNVPDLQAPGRDNTTLLYFAVTHTWQHREAVEAVRTLLSLGAKPNYTNGHDNSFALAAAVHGPLEGLRAMLDAGGDPNSLSEYGWPLVFRHFKLSYYQNEELARLDLLLDRGADINATVPRNESECAGYPLLLYATRSGKNDRNEYVEALHLLERGADPKVVAPDGMTFAKMLAQQRKQFAAEQSEPRSFTSLVAWVENHGIAIPK